jgi:hypothetical protein
MLDTAIQKLIEQAPWAAAMLGLAWMLLRYAERTQDKMLAAAEKERAERIASAAEKAERDRETQIIVGKAYADAINNQASIVSDLKATVVEQYKNLGITQEIIDMMKELKETKNKTRRGDD